MAESTSKRVRVGEFVRFSFLKFLLAIPGVLFPTVAGAQDGSGVRLYVENDFFNPFEESTDRYYTQGMRIEYLSSSDRFGEDFLPGIGHEDWCSLICGDRAGESGVVSGISIGQNMYTPADITIAAPQPSDRPWAGVAYVSRIARLAYPEPSLRAQREDRIELTLGIVGPASFAGDTQIWWHKVIDAPRPNGWANQLENEPIVQLRYDVALRWPEEDGGHADLITRVRGNVGNGTIAAEAEVVARVGWNLSGFGVQTIPSAPVAMPPGDWDEQKRSSTADSRSERRGWLSSGNLFLRAGLRAVAHNILLDGNTFADNDIRIVRRPLVPEIAAGIEVNLVSDFWLSFQFVQRGSELETQRGRAAPAQRFGALTLAWAFRD